APPEILRECAPKDEDFEEKPKSKDHIVDWAHAFNFSARSLIVAQKKGVPWRHPLLVRCLAGTTST
ncbi:MAG: hypothetical protein ACE5JL_18195, partial [Dehalococcoidia bacterium]